MSQSPQSENNKKIWIIPVFSMEEFDSLFSIKRNIETMYNHIRDIVFNDMDDDLSEEDKDYLMQFFNWSYWTSKAKFQSLERNVWWRSFDHLIWVTYLMLYFSKEPTFSKVLISMFHDIIEDTDIDFDWIKKTHWNPYTALWVELISKEPFYNFINQDSNDYKIFESIKNSGIKYHKWILNDKNILSDDFIRRKLKNKEKYKEKRLNWEEYNLLSEREQDDNISPEEWEAYDNYKILESKYKEIRNKFYFNHMINFDTFHNYTLELKKKHKIRIRDSKLKEICYEALEVKYWDRIHNLMTAEIKHVLSEQNLNKARRKIDETKKYFYNISRETHPYIADLIIEEVNRLEKYIIEQEIIQTQNQTKKSVEKNSK
jgi:hypothetical protein